MDNRSDVREFLSTRRARISPDQAGLPAYGGNRRVPGLRREEVAMLAGISIDYYTRLERGNLGGRPTRSWRGSPGALQLDDAETSHLFDLARAATPSPRAPTKSTRTPGVRPSIQRLLDAITGAPALIRNSDFDYVAANPLARALYSPVFAPARPEQRPVHLPESAGQGVLLELGPGRQELVATLRGVAGRNPYDKRLTDLIGELSTRSERFRTLWAAHNVRHHRTGIKRLHHPVVGDLELVYEAFELPADPGLTLSTYTAEPGTSSEDALKLWPVGPLRKPRGPCDPGLPPRGAEQLLGRPTRRPGWERQGVRRHSSARSRSARSIVCPRRSKVPACNNSRAASTAAP